MVVIAKDVYRIKVTQTYTMQVGKQKHCSFFSRNIGWVTLKLFIFVIYKNMFQIKLSDFFFSLIFKAEALSCTISDLLLGCFR